jgi:hypothetical protein
VRFLVLGPLEVVADGGDSLPIAGSKERTVLAFLLARGGRVVSVDDLVEELWGEPPPTTLSSVAMTSIVAERLCGSILMITWPIAFAPARFCCDLRARRAPLLRAEQTPLEPLLAHCGTRSAQAR